MNREQFADDEWYHCYNRGVDKRRTFIGPSDYTRMQELLFLANSDTPIHRSNREHIAHSDVFSITRGKPLVDIAAYCLMPNHFHILLRQTSESGVSLFMRKLMTAYTMYFNIKNERVGNLFYKPFRSRHVADDRYAQRVHNYIHANPWELVRSKPRNAQCDFIESYEYSSIIDHTNHRPESAIIKTSSKVPFILKSTQEILSDAHLFDNLTAR